MALTFICWILYAISIWLLFVTNLSLNRIVEKDQCSGGENRFIAERKSVLTASCAD